MELWQQIVLASLPILIGGLITVLTARNSRAQQMIDQLQEQNDKLERRVGRLERHERIRDDYIIRLRQHINDELGPPAPEWPEGLTTLG